MTTNGHDSLEPRAVATGTPQYYVERLGDFQLRSAGPPPSYYADYGDKCLHQFLATKPSMSPRGQQWVEDTMRLLQEMMEQERHRDTCHFAALEHDDESFRDFAFGTHSRAYYQAGVFDLGFRDLWKIVRTPDLKDLLSDDGLKEIIQLLLRSDDGSDGITDLEAAPADGSGVLGSAARSVSRVRSAVHRLGRWSR